LIFNKILTAPKSDFEAVFMGTFMGVGLWHFILVL